MKGTRLILVIPLLASCKRIVEQAPETFEYEVCYYLDRSTGGERCVVEFGNRKILVYDTTEDEPFYQFCKKEFPEAESKPDWVLHDRTLYKNDLEPNWPNPRPGQAVYLCLYMPYEPYAVELFREIKRNGGKAWADTKEVLRQAFRASNNETPARLSEFLAAWILLKTGRWGNGKWTGPWYGAQEDAGWVIYEAHPSFDRPRSLAIRKHKELGSFYGTPKPSGDSQ